MPSLASTLLGYALHNCKGVFRIGRSAPFVPVSQKAIRIGWTSATQRKRSAFWLPRQVLGTATPEVMPGLRQVDEAQRRCAFDWAGAPVDTCGGALKFLARPLATTKWQALLLCQMQRSHGKGI
jgi:hypothetical protein